MARIIYDHQVFSWQRYGGISRYIYEVANHLYESEDLDIKILAIAYINEYLKSCKKKLVVGFPLPYISKHKIQKMLGRFNDEVSKIWLQKNTPDILHQTYYNSPNLIPKDTKVVITVHDMIHEKMPEFFQHENKTKCKTYIAKQEAVKRADRIICVSESTKKDLIDLLDVDKSKISVIYHGYSLNSYPSDRQCDERFSQPYILYVGDRGGYKNFQRFLLAYASSSQLTANFQIVCFGGGQLEREEINQIQALGLPAGKILHFSGDDQFLANLYRKAALFVYPSLYEGFGIPILEAMSLNCPVACSNTSCLPEVAGNAAQLFNPDEPESIADAMEKVLFSKVRSQNLVDLGIERSKQFSWQICAEKTKEVYLSML